VDLFEFIVCKDMEYISLEIYKFMNKINKFKTSLITNICIMKSIFSICNYVIKINNNRLNITIIKYDFVNIPFLNLDIIDDTLQDRFKN
jgi:hypothetical protein